MPEISYYKYLFMATRNQFSMWRQILIKLYLDFPEFLCQNTVNLPSEKLL